MKTIDQFTNGRRENYKVPKNYGKFETISVTATQCGYTERLNINDRSVRKRTPWKPLNMKTLLKI